MSAHTPGPWEVRQSRADRTYTHITAATNDSVACTKSEADARLIAAAPDMLAALELVAEQIRHESPDERCRQAIGAAINKARGRGIGALLAEDA